jgi:hypothetical protein
VWGRTEKWIFLSRAAGRDRHLSIPPPSCQIDANEVGASFQKKGQTARDRSVH